MIDAHEVDSMIADIVKRAELLLVGRDGPLLPEPREDIKAILTGAQQFQAVLGRFAENPAGYEGSVIHDLRGRLNSVTGFAEMLIDDPDAGLNDTQREVLDTVYHDGLTLRDYVNTTFRATISEQ
jgi:signal transduction histidine kinase